jgi:polyprenyl P-hydroxybenzoate/phenylacrylic acid decarboxylase-like protein
MAKAAARLIVGISGASGTVYGVRLLEMLRKAEIETHLVMSRSAEMTLAYETDYKPKDVRALASVHYPVTDIGAAISSGSFPTMGMIIAPCSIRTMSEIASGVTASLLSRAADVVLKEKRRLVLALRETPLHDRACRDRRGDRADRAGILQSPAHGRRPCQSHLRPVARPVRNRHRNSQALEGRWTSGG